MTRRHNAWLFVGLVVAACGTPTEHAATDDRVSEFGRYEGYSEARFDEWIRTSQYLSVRDGTKLAVDIVRPAVDGVAVDEAFPVIWTHSRYHRTPAALAAVLGRDSGGDDGGGDAAGDTAGDAAGDAEAGGAAAGDAAAGGAGIGEDPDPAPLISYVDVSPTLQRLVRHGYVFVGVGVRGSGASYGRYEGLFSPNETRDAYDVIDWVSQQPWSDGNVGMWGGSYLGITQYMAASTRHPALKAIFPNVALFDMYDIVYPGGVHRDDMLEHWGLLTRDLDVNVLSPAVDEDPDGSMRAAAIEEHSDNWEVITEFGAAPFRDHDSDSFAWSRHTPSTVLEEINASGVAAYHWGGWWDVFALDEALWWANYGGPQKLTIGPWSHTSQGQSLAGPRRARLESIEHHRWFDYWLKGIDNGVMDEPPVNYAVMDEAGRWSWASANAWPPAGIEAVTFYFVDGPSGSVDSVNDGLLARDAPEASAFDEYTVDPATTTGAASRWDNAVGQGAMAYPDMAANDARSLTYTTEPLEAAVTVTGHPVVTLWVTSSTGDADFHVLLEEVDARGVSHYISEGVLRASHRTPTEAPWNNLGLPFQKSAAADPQPLPDAPTELVLDLIPTSQVFNAGHRIRITVMGADADNTLPVLSTKSPTIRLYRGSDHPSGVRLPVAK